MESPIHSASDQSIEISKPPPKPKAPLKFAVTPSVVIEPPASTPAATAYPLALTSMSIPKM